jgi:hypothetical protein
VLAAELIVISPALAGGMMLERFRRDEPALGFLRLDMASPAAA